MLFDMVGKSKKYFIAPALAFIFYGIALLVNTDLVKPKIEVTKQDSAINFNTTFLKLFSMGNKRFISDLIWVQTLLESDDSHYKKRDLNSWMYIRFNNIAALDPNFYQNYLWGGIYLSIIKDDRLGAAEIFEKGLKIFPDDYDLNFNASFNYYAQLGNYSRAYELLKKIQHHPKSPAFLPTLAAKIKFQNDFDYQGTIEFLLEQYKTTKDEMVKQKIEKNIYALKAENDLNCLNAGLNDCEKIDAHGRPYQKIDGQFKAARPFTPYRLNLNTK